MRLATLIILVFVLAAVPSTSDAVARTPVADDASMSVDVQLFIYEDFIRKAGDGCGIDLEKEEAFLVAQPFLLTPEHYVSRSIFDGGSIVDGADSPVGEAGCLIDVQFPLEEEVLHYAFWIGETLLGVVWWDDLTNPDAPILLAIDEEGSRTLAADNVEIGQPAPTPSPVSQAGQLENGDYLISGFFVLRSERVVNDSRGCRGAGGYDDVYPGAQVVVRDGNGNILGVDRLKEDTEKSGPFGCSYRFFIEVPETEFYVIEFGRRGETIYTFDEMEERHWQVILGLSE